eukprot:6202750-Pleurochrysis_carterae.AAC.1
MFSAAALGFARTAPLSANGEPASSGVVGLKARGLAAVAPPARTWQRRREGKGGKGGKGNGTHCAHTLLIAHNSTPVFARTS